jgi:hypothetical protein
MWSAGNLDACSGGGWGIYSPQPPIGCWGRLLSMGAPDTVRCASHVTQPLGFGRCRPLEALSSSGIGQFGAAPDRSVHCSVRLWRLLWLQRALFAHCSSDPRFCSRPLRRRAVAPLVHRIVRWHTGQSGELQWSAPWETRELRVGRCTVLVHRTLSGGTPDSPVR